MDKTLKRIYITIYIAGVLTSVFGFIAEEKLMFIFSIILQTLAFAYFMIMWSEKGGGK